jgi:branched-chain amino acid aminotransferase
MHQFLLHNDEILDSSARVLTPGQVGLLSGWGVFSTLRVYDGVPFAFERHWARMKADAIRMHVPFPTHPEWLEERLLKLIEANQAWNCTMRVSVVRNRGGLFEGPDQTRDFDVIGFTVDRVKWPQSVQLSILEQGRHAGSEFAGTKYLSWAENLARYERAHEQGFDEVILLNEHGDVSECTSANVFVVNGSRVWTPPLASGCLPGVTRAVLLEQIQLPGFEIGEKTLTPADLEIADEVFITSTTRELLPASRIQGMQIPGGHTVCDALQKAFAGHVKEYVASRRRALSSK